MLSIPELKAATREAGACRVGRQLLLDWEADM